MPYTTAAENTGIAAVGAAANWISLHDADPGTTGTATEISGGAYARKQVTWGTAANGEIVATAAAQIDVPAGVTITHWGLWTTSTGGTFYFGDALPAPESFGSAGTYALTPTLTATN